MKDITVRVDEELHEQLQDMAEQEGESMSVIVRRLVRQGVRGGRPDTQRRSLAHEGTGRVQ